MVKETTITRPEVSFPPSVGAEGRLPRESDPRLRGDDLLSRIGETPLIPLVKVGREFPGVELLVKAEWFNPGGSVKDRAAASIIAEAERTGQLHRGRILLDATSGNTGIAYAMIGAAKGYRVKLCVPANAGRQVLQTIRAFGAELVLTSPLEGSDGAIREAQRLAALDQATHFYANQYGNPANWQAHYRTTGPEIWEQSRGEVTHLVAGLGTSGTFVGVGRFLKERNPAIRLVSVQPDSSLHGLEGLKHMPTSIVPGIYDAALADQNLEIDTEEAYRLVKRLAAEEGLLVGISSGAAVAAGLRLASELKQGSIVMIFPDGGSRYLDEPFWR